MSCSCKKTRTSFPSARRAVKRIENKKLRRDFGNFINGLEHGLASGDRALAEFCANGLVGMTVALNQTIKPTVATKILEGIAEDGEKTRIAQFLAGIIWTTKNARCVARTNFCKKKKNASCVQFGGGCGGASGFQFRWDLGRA